MSTPAINVTSATAAELLAFYNAHSGNNPIKRFADRRAAEKRVSALLAERQFNVPAPLPEVSEEDASYVSDYGFAHCPACGTHLSNGVGHDGQEVNGKVVRHSHFEFQCLGCNVEFGPSVAARVKVLKPTANVFGPRPAMVESLKIDRRIMHVETGAVHKNANCVRKAGLITPSQGDRLSGALYRAAKAGDRKKHVVINGHTFCMAEA